MKKIFTIFVLSMCLICFGCNSSKLDGLSPAGGVVKFNGQPVGNALVIFNPVGETRAASATTNANGSFTMMTLNPGDGVYPGEYIVTVTKAEYRGEMREEGSGKNRVVIDTREVIEHLPLQYADVKSSGLTATIPANGNKKIELNLTGEADTSPKKVNELKRR
ncbi:MAG: carboxypeptidase-like regulatory domain-containing protein [Planctomycetaceae bacterium]|nr:carboxypeptidase-like regulatory domain-containing protein [Planctomycetaceae bacterium]